MKPVRFHPDADAEMVDAAVWYESRQEDLGKRFLTAVQDALNRIEVNPELYPFSVVMNDLSFEWDERKNCENQRKHGVSFELTKPGGGTRVLGIPIRSSQSDCSPARELLILRRG